MTEHDPEESDALFNFVAWLDANRLTAIIVAGVALIGGFYFYISQFNADQLVGEAGSTLEATNMVSRQIGIVPPESYKSVMNQYPDSSAGRRAWLLWARGLLDAGDYEGAQKQFEGFLAKNPKSPMAPGAKLGSALCLDELNNKDEAKAKYDQIIKEYHGELVAQYAMINLAALNWEDGHLKTTQDTYQDLLDTDPTFLERASVQTKNERLNTSDVNRDRVEDVKDIYARLELQQQVRFFFRWGSQRLPRDLAQELEAVLLSKNPQLRTETSNPHIPPTIPTEPESNATKLLDNNGTVSEANATKPKPDKDKPAPKGKSTSGNPKKSSK